MQTITLFEGDGIGPEITEATLQVLKALDVPLQFEKYDIGLTSFNKTGELIPEEALASIKKNKTALKAPVTTPVGHGFRSVNVGLRLAFDLYANIRPIESIPGVKTRYDDIDLVIFRENTEDLYIGLETVIKEDEEVHAIKKITRAASERIIHQAFRYAVEHHKDHVTCVHKANILKQADGLFLKIFNEIKEQYPSIKADALIVDNACMQLVMYPEKYQVLVMPNLYGDILSDLCSGLVGGLGLAPSVNTNNDIAIFEAIHGSAPDIAGQNKANPTALMLSAVMMLEHLGYNDEAKRMRNAIYAVYEEGKTKTADLGGHASTAEFTQAVISKL